MNGKHYNNQILYDFPVFPLDNPDAMVCSYYDVFIQNYLDDLIGSDTTIGNLYNDGKHLEKQKLIFGKINELQISPLIKDVYMSIYLDKLMNDDFRTFLKVYADLKPRIENEAIAAAIDNDLSQRLDQLHTNSGTKLESGDEVLKSLLSEINTKLNSDYYLIDVWGLGCAPCLAAMPKMYKLREELKLFNTSVVFLCAPSDSTRWNQTTERFGSYSGHFLLNRQEWDHIRKKLSFSSVPRYFIIDRDGNIPYENISGLDKNHLEDLINNLRI
jgi:thiol-disulfide isomerase/thioredoxin